MTGHTEPPWPCPCCGYLVFAEPPGSYDNCPVCGWEDDLSQLRFAAQGGGANELSLIEAQQSFAWREAHGDNELDGPPEARGYQRDPTWRCLDSGYDHIEIARAGKDYGRSYADSPTAYYYWRRADPRDWRLDIADRCIDLYLELSDSPRPIDRRETEMLLDVIDAWRALELRKHSALTRALAQADASLRYIGRVESPLSDRTRAQQQDEEGASEAWLEFLPDVVDALDGIAIGDRLTVVTWTEGADRTVLELRPRDDAGRLMRGVFSTRTADRPNPIGLHEVVVLAIDDRRVKVSGLEALDGTPIVDVKPTLNPLDMR